METIIHLFNLHNLLLVITGGAGYGVVRLLRQFIV